MKLSVIESGKFKLDGGAMFGVVPKTMWEGVNPPDDANLCTWSMRSLLIEHDNRKILVDTGIGMKQSEKFRSHFHPHGMNAVSSLEEKGIKADEITDVFLTHLHFDHVGGAVFSDSNAHLLPTFKNAQYWSTKKHYDWALNPNPREAASFLKENIIPLEEHGVLNFIDEKENIEWLPGINIRFVHGHTQSMMLLDIHHPSSRIFYAADLFPSSGHISLPWVMAYDVRPLETLKEKELILNEALETDAFIFFEHDPLVECASVHTDKRGRIRLAEKHKLSEIV